jgi:tetratricopeptide (TPR) repeat protein
VSDIATDNFNLGIQSMNNNEFAKAETYFQLAVAEAPENVEFLVSLSRSFYQQRKYVDVVEVLRRATKIRPTNAEIHHLLGNAFLVQERYENAAESFSKAVDLAPDNVQYRDDLRRTLNANPERAARAHADRGNRFILLGNFNEALHSFKEAAAADPQNREYQTTVRDIEIRISQQKHMDNAADAYRKAEKERTTTRTYTKKDGTTGETTSLTKEITAMYKMPIEEVAKAERLGGLTSEWQETANFYKSEAKKYESRRKWGAVASTIGGIGALGYAAANYDGESSEK